MSKKSFFYCVLFLFFATDLSCFCQKLKYSSNGLGFTRGTINTEILSDIISAKQEEVQIRVFRNLIINNFVKACNNEKNFALYYYIYNTMRNLTLEKNKKIITQKTTNNFIEFALIYSYTAALLEKYGDPTNDSHKDFMKNLQSLAKINPSQMLLENEKLTITDLLLTEKNRNINFILASNEFINEQYNTAVSDSSNKEKVGKIQQQQKEQQQQQQQQQQLQQQQQVGNTKDEVIIQKAFIKQKLINFLIDFCFDYLRNDKNYTNKKLFVSSLRNEDNFKSWRKSDSQYKKLYRSDYDEDSIKTTTSYSNLVGNMQKLTTEIFNKGATTSATNNFSFYLSRIYILINNLESDGFNIDKLKKEQYDNYKQLLINLISLLRQTDLNNTASNVVNFTLDYTLIEYREDGSDGVLFVDIESLIQALDQKYNNRERKSSIGNLALVPRPYFSIGINDGLFLYKNELSANGGNLKNIYLASEKIGLKIKVADWKYVNSFQPGETYKFWGTHYTTLVPRKEPLVADMYLSLYASGVLYNVANLRTDNNFSSGFVGVNVGFTFFNGLNFNAGFARPFNTNLYKKENTFFTLSFDIPLIEYIVAARKNKK